MSGGFYLMHRGWMDDPLFKDEPYCERLAWQWLIHDASFEPHKVRYHNRMIEVKRGQVPTSYRKLSERFKWSSNRVRGFLAILEQDGKIETQTDTGFLVITICQYDRFQRPLTKSDTRLDTNAETDPDTDLDTDSDTNIKKGKELKERKRKKQTGDYSPEFLLFWTQYLKRSGSKFEAFKSYQKSIEQGFTHEIIIDGLAKFNAHAVAAGTEQKYLPAAATWLNQRRWEGDYTIVLSGGGPARKSDAEKVFEATARARAAREQRSANQAG